MEGPGSNPGNTRKHVSWKQSWERAVQKERMLHDEKIASEASDPFKAFWEKSESNAVQKRKEEVGEVYEEEVASDFESVYNNGDGDQDDCYAHPDVDYEMTRHGYVRPVQKPVQKPVQETPDEGKQRKRLKFVKYTDERCPISWYEFIRSPLVLC